MLNKIYTTILIDFYYTVDTVDTAQGSSKSTPKSHGGHYTAVLHRICHRQIHTVFTETELARQFNTVEQLKLQADMASFIEWVRLKPDDFFERTRKSKRLKSK